MQRHHHPRHSAATVSSAAVVSVKVEVEVMASLFRRGLLRDKKSSNHPPTAAPPRAAAGALVCHACKCLIARSDRHIAIQLKHQLNYHITCFVCLHCHAPINPQCEEFCYSSAKSFPNRIMNIKGGPASMKVRDDSKKEANNKAEDKRESDCTNDDHGDKNDDRGNNKAHAGRVDDDGHLFHRVCFAHRFGWLCVVCEKPLPMVTKLIDSSDDAIDEAINVSDDNITGPPSSNRNHDALEGSHMVADDNRKSTVVHNLNQNLKCRRTTKVDFLKHPFFNELVCPHHAGSPPRPSARNAVMLQSQESAGLDYHNYKLRDRDYCGGNNYTSFTGPSAINHADVACLVSDERTIVPRLCAGCHRFEPSLASPGKHFVNVGDPNSGQCLCLACCRTVVTSAEDVIPLWNRVIDFFEGPLGLLTSEDSYTIEGRRIKGGVTRQDLKTIPIMMVGMEALNDNMRVLQSDHFGSNQIMTRGMCLSEHDTNKDDDDQEQVLTGVVTAILCLVGLPSDLTASILAHEATHAYIKLHPNFSFSHTNPLPHYVEEGLAQLVAHLFLSDVTASEADNTDGVGGGVTVEDDSIPSDEKLRQYFRYCIETDDGEYGEGFRWAARAYAEMGIQELLYYVALHRCFPPM